MTNYSRSVLKSNGPHRSKNFPVKFDFSPKTVPANIVQKLSAHSLLKSVFFRISTSLTNAPRSLSRAKVGTHSAFRERSHTTAHTPKQGPSGRGRYHYPRSVPHVHQHPRAGYQNGKFCRFWGLVGRGSRRTQKAFGTAMRLCASLFRGVAAPLGCVIFFAFVEIGICTSGAQGLSACARRGGVSRPSACSACC